MADRLDTAFRELADAPEPAGLRPPSGVRRRGDQRRRSTWAGAAVAVGILAVGVIGVADAVRTTGSDAPPAGPAPSASMVESLPANPFLRVGDMPLVSRNDPFTVTGPVDAAQPFLLDCWGAPVNPEAWQGVKEGARQGFASDPDGILVETVVLFRDEQSAVAATESFAGTCQATPGARGSTVQVRPVSTSDDRQVGRVTIPKGDADVGYQELAVVRQGNLVVVLDWSSMGLPWGEDNESAMGWRWAIPEETMTRAVDRALGG